MNNRERNLPTDLTTFSLDELRPMFDKNRPGTRHNRVMSIVDYCRYFGEKANSNDPYHKLKAFMPDDISTWVFDNTEEINKLCRRATPEAKRDYDYLRADTKPFENSRWLHLAKQASDRYSLNDDMRFAETAIRKLYAEAALGMEDHDQAARKALGQTASLSALNDQLGTAS